MICRIKLNVEFGQGRQNSLLVVAQFCRQKRICLSNDGDYIDFCSKSLQKVKVQLVDRILARWRQKVQ